MPLVLVRKRRGGGGWGRGERGADREEEKGSWRGVAIGDLGLDPSSAAAPPGLSLLLFKTGPLVTIK